MTRNDEWTDEFRPPRPSTWLALANSTRRSAGASEPAPPETAKGAPLLVVPEGSPGATIRALRPAHDPTTIELEIRGRFDRTDAARLGREVRALLEERDARQIVCDVGAVFRSDVAVVDVLCRMRLAARRRGCQLQVRDASTELLDLLSLVGLSDVIPIASSSGVEAEGQTEKREHPLRVEEERDPADPSV
jgi:anti-anti-sigma factor